MSALGWLIAAAYGIICGLTSWGIETIASEVWQWAFVPFVLLGGILVGVKVIVPLDDRRGAK